ncbi:MAG: preprotein translocase subunit SecG [Chloroflexi bacterium]|nr:MAG: preprotein translocase subunit SecG [Chloroflexota bacterium]
MELRHYLSIAQIMISVVLSVLVLLQVKGTGFGAALGGQDSQFRTRRGMQRTMHRMTIVLVIVFLAFSAWSVAAS